MEKLRCKFEKYKYGFTLAEVLITLVIVGVVAALTISPLVNTYVESSTVAKVKKGLSILGQAKKLAETQNGSIEGWDFGEGYTSETARLFWNYLKPHIAVTKDCGSGTDCYQSNGIYRLSGIMHDINHNTNNKYYKFVLADGGVMWFRTSTTGKCSATEGGLNNACACFFYDINGEKAPNTFGKDIFVYEMGVDAVIPYNGSESAYRCSKTGGGQNCGTYIIQHGNMNYLH